MSTKLKLIAVAAAAVLMALVLLLGKQVQGHLSRPETPETASTETTQPETTDYSGDELPMLPFN